MSDHPYMRLPNKAFWNRSVARMPADSVDPVDVFDLRIGPQTKVATAGSCFAQHIARHLRESGFNYYVAEPGHPILPLHIRQRHNYGVFSARYGNIYTARQLMQLLHRAYGRFRPAEEAWTGADGAILDPFRPAVQPGGFISVAEMLSDREQHLAAVRTMFETLDVFVFTLGLTECWTSRIDGAVFPICPGVNGGTFDPARYAFHNQHVDEVVSDMSEFVEALKAVNGRAEIVLTVSPVPLAATAQPSAHVLSATTYSKSVLRVAAEHLRRRHAHVHYFPSYEIITGAFNRGRYYAEDLRNVTEAGVSHVMRLFLHHATEGAAEKTRPLDRRSTEQIDNYTARAEHIVEVECDEIALDR